MYRVWGARLVASGVMFLLLTPFAPVAAATPGNGACSAATGLGELEEAECTLDLGACSSSCAHFRFEITVTADSSVAGLATVFVTGAIGGIEVCSGADSCTGSLTATQSRWDIGLPCEGSGLEAGLLAPPVLTSLSMTCTRTLL